MKKWFWFFTAALIPTFIIACGKNKQNADTFATAPTDMSCLYGAGNCDNSYYNKYNDSGFTAYPGPQTVASNPQSVNRYDVYNNAIYQNQNQTLYCSCPQGTRPIFNGSIGLGCVQLAVIAGVQNNAYYWGQQSSNYDWVNWNQVSNMNNSAGAGGCYSNVAWSCFTDVANSCFPGQVCSGVSGGSRIGICTRTQ